MHRIAVCLVAIALYASPAIAASKACTAREYSQFDFWVGNWDVYNKADPKKAVKAHSKIEKLYDGCAIRENWMPLGNAGGGSLNTFIPEKKVWRQFWTDGQGTTGDFTGGWNGKAMVIEGPWPQPGHAIQRTRISYTPLSDGTVEQAGVSSDDNGKTWQQNFDLIYRPGR